MIFCPGPTTSPMLTICSDESTRSKHSYSATAFWRYHSRQFPATRSLCIDRADIELFSRSIYGESGHSESKPCEYVHMVVQEVETGKHVSNIIVQRCCRPSACAFTLSPPATRTLFEIGVLLRCVLLGSLTTAQPALVRCSLWAGINVQGFGNVTLEVHSFGFGCSRKIAAPGLKPRVIAAPPDHQIFRGAMTYQVSPMDTTVHARPRVR